MWTRVHGTYDLVVIEFNFIVEIHTPLRGCINFFSFWIMIKCMKHIQTMKA